MAWKLYCLDCLALIDVPLLRGYYTTWYHYVSVAIINHACLLQRLTRALLARARTAECAAKSVTLRSRASVLPVGLATTAVKVRLLLISI